MTVLREVGRVLGALAVVGAALSACTAAAPTEADHTVSTAAPVVATAPPAVAPAAPTVTPIRCPFPAPSTAGGYAKMFAGLDAKMFGGADVGISVPLADGRVVWLFGDTVTNDPASPKGKRVGIRAHSTAVTQDGGCLHVSNFGMPLLPDRKGAFYWIEAAKATGPATLAITAEETRRTGSGPWDFAYTGYTATATVSIDKDGNLTFRRWTKRVKAPAADPGTLIVLGPGHVGYSIRSHPEAVLASGKTLRTMAQNWDDGKPRPVSAYRLIFFER